MRFSHIILPFVSLAFVISANAQSAADLLKEDPSRAADLHHSYEVPEIHDSKAPKGYKPFYVSHYGRHGSRYHTSDTYFKRVNPILDTLYKLNLLTEEGKSVRNDILALTEAQKGVDGILTQKGSLEHQGISQRLYERVPKVFKQKDRNEVMLASSTILRCVQSMANFGTTLKSNAPDLKISYYTGDKYMDYICTDVDTKSYSKRSSFIKDSLINALIKPERLIKAWFTNPAEADKYLGKYSEAAFVEEVYYAGGIDQCFDEDLPAFYRHFTQDEIYALWRVINATQYNTYCESTDNKFIRRIVGQKILKDFVDKADEAVAGNHKAADFRFGHDSGLGPFLTLIQVDGYDKVFKVGEEYNHWLGFYHLPMGSNFQMIFYKNKKGDVLVKLLRNENETTIPALKPYEGYYYKWSDLRAWFEKLLN